MVRKRRVLITGAGGQLGRALQSVAGDGWELFPFSSVELDIRNWHHVRDTMATIAPDLVIHAAAATNVDRCEREPDWAFTANALGTRHVAQAAALVDADLVYVSTNYVFSGEKSTPYHEFDATGPISVYGESKLAGEDESLCAGPRCYVVRTASVYAESGTNFVATMLRLMREHERITVVNDQFSNPTYAGDLARAILQLAQGAPFGTYHVTNQGEASWYDWAVAVRDISGLECEVQPIPAAEYKRDATPPANGCMNSLALAGLGIELPDWRSALKGCLSRWPE